MPLIHCHVTRGMSARQKQELIGELAEVTHSILDVDRRLVIVVLQEHDAADVKQLGDPWTASTP